MKTKKYLLGNFLRGAFEGDFASLEEAWEWLSDRFLLSYPAEGGRHVLMYVYEANQYFPDDPEKAVQTLCKQEVTSLIKHPEKEVLDRCKYSQIPWTSL